jgi:hypothetical protein
MLSLPASLAGSEIGLNCYLAPEYKSAGTLVPASDIYSLGIHVVRLVTGRLPCPYVIGESGAGSAPLRYVANSFFRRGVPEALVRVILKTLLPDPSCRYRFCAEFANDMRHYLSEPEPSANGDGSDPVAPGPVVASRYIPSFDSSAYFRETLSERKTDGGESIYPVKSPAVGPDVDAIEREELVISAEESGWSIDDYIANAKRVVSGMAGPARKVDTDELRTMLEFPTVAPKQVDEPISELASIDRDLPNSTTPEIGKAFPSITISVQSSGADIIGQVTSGTRVERRDARHRSEARRRTSPRSATGDRSFRDADARRGCLWTYQRIRLQDVVGIVQGAARRAREGYGSFRYIQEPESGYHNSDVFSSLEALSDTCLYVNAGSCARYGIADTDDFYRMLAKAISERLRGESKNALMTIRRAVASKDTYRIFRIEPLGKILFGSNVRPGKSLHGSDVDVYDSVARSLAAFGRPKRPLVIVIRGGERISRGLHDLFETISAETNRSPFVVVVFFERMRFAEWHTLSRLSD